MQSGLEAYSHSQKAAGPASSARVSVKGSSEGRATVAQIARRLAMNAYRPVLRYAMVLGDMTRRVTR